MIEESNPSSVMTRLYTSKQMGDACEMLVAAELTLAGVPALKVPDNWPHYDVLAQTSDACLHKLSVKSRTFKRGGSFVTYNDKDLFDWLAIVLLQCPEGETRQIYIIPREEADRLANKGKKGHGYCEFTIDSVSRKFRKFKNNFLLHQLGDEA